MRPLAPYRTEAVVLRTYDLGETDKILVLFTRAEGKASAVAKGARKPKGRFVAGSQSFTYCDYLLYRGKNLDMVTQYEIINSHRHIREDLEKLAYASYASELVLEMTHDRDPAPGVLDLLLWALGNIEAGRNLGALRHVFELRLMDTMGYRPQLTSCAMCGKAISGSGKFSPAMGGLLCSSCVPGTTIIPVSEGTLASLRLLQDGSESARWDVLRLQGDVGLETSRVMDEFIQYRVEKRLKSLEFIKSLPQVK